MYIHLMSHAKTDNAKKHVNNPNAYHRENPVRNGQGYAVLKG